MLQVCKQAAVKLKLITPNNIHNIENYKSIWGYVAIAFNRVDEERLKKVGPDRLCAEWILKNGGGVCFVELPGRFINDYNCLPPESSQLHIKVVNATKASVMKIGLEHFVNCKQINTVIFHHCMHLEEDGLGGLLHLKDTLNTLQVSHCYNLTDEGLKVIGELKNLKYLKLFDFRYVKNLDQVVNYLKQQLPNCNISSKEDNC